MCSVLLAMLASGAAFARPSTGQSAGPAQSSDGFGALAGPAAAAFRVPSDVRLVRTWRDAKHNLNYSRYQQYVQPHDAAVDGAQMTVVKRGGTVVLVIGAHYDNLRVTNRLLVTGAEAVAHAAADKNSPRQGAAADNGAKAKHGVQLWLNPTNGRLFQQVESGGTGANFVHQVDAETGEIIDSWDATMDAGTGTGVRGDTKDLTDLTTEITPSEEYRLRTSDNRIQTHNAGGTGNMETSPVMSDADDAWNATFQRAGVDAHYYTALTDDWYMQEGLFDLVDDCAERADDPVLPWTDDNLHSVVHYGTNYANAFFDSSDGRFGYGDGDGVDFRAMSGGQDVVSHELTHRATECRAPLEYTSFSGALNEAISDIMAAAIEWETNEPVSTNCRREAGQSACPDWWIGEDVVLSGIFGFRNMADPGSVGDPSHWDDRYKGFQDNSGVHINSLIPGHAFHLMVNGGRNARCSGPTDPQADCDVVVPAIPIDDAAAIMFAGWGLLPNPTPGNTAAFNRQFCNAHAASVYEAALMFPGSPLHVASTDLAWTAVGRGSGPDTTAPGDDCQPPNAFNPEDPEDPEPATFAPHITPRSIVLGQGTSGSLDTTTTNGHTVSVSGGDAATVTYDGPNTEIDITVPSDMDDGVYPILLTETDGTHTAYAGATLIIDLDPPTASVDGVGLPSSGQVGTNGSVPLQVTWSASDAQSGIGTSELQKSITGIDPWNPVASGGSAGTSTVNTTDATDYFRLSTIDGAGNDTISPVSGPWNISRQQENAATYSGIWSAMPSSPAFGTTRFTTKSGAWARFNFSGKEVLFVSTRAVGRGKVKIFLDGVFQRKVNLATGTLGARQIVYRATGLSAGSHVIRIQNITAGKRVDVDGIVSLSQ